MADDIGRTNDEMRAAAAVRSNIELAPQIILVVLLESHNVSQWNTSDNRGTCTSYYSTREIS